jgi:hypothetical protein
MQSSGLSPLFNGRFLAQDGRLAFELVNAQAGRLSLLW